MSHRRRGWQDYESIKDRQKGAARLLPLMLGRSRISASTLGVTPAIGLTLLGAWLGVGACTTPAEIGNSVASDTGTTTEAPAEAGCQQFDMLFVIDDSEGMAAAHHRLIDAVPVFIRRFRNATGVDPVNLMVVDTSGGRPPKSEPVHECQGADCCVAMCEQGSIKPYPYCSEDGGPMRTCAEWRMELEFDECDRSLGAGRIYSGGEYRDCMGLEEGRFLASLDAPLGGAFGCVGNVGDGGNPDEQITDAMTRALEMAQPGECNEGFLRDDAVLIVTIFTSAAEGQTGSTVAEWREAVAAAKQGDESKIVMLGIFGDGDLPEPVCDPATGEADDAPRLRQFVESYGEQGVTCSICALDYEACFDEAVVAVERACPSVDEA